MRISQIFPGSKTGQRLLIEKAGALDNFEKFKAAIQARSSATLPAILRELSRALDDLAGVPSPAVSCEAKPVMAGQQPYVDYSLDVAAKVDALRAGKNIFAGYFGFTDYDFFGSDQGIGQIRLPNPWKKVKRPFLNIRIHRRSSSRKIRDMRFVPPPSKMEITNAFARLKEALLFALHRTGRQDRKKEVLEKLAALLADFLFAERRATHAAAFNMIWSVRTFRRLGYETPFFSISDLLYSPELTPAIAEILQPVILENRLFIESIDHVLQEAGACDLGVRPLQDGYLPLFLTDRRTGKRLPLVLLRVGGDHMLGVRDRPEIAVSLGQAGLSDIADALHRLKGLWSPSVFVPLLLYRVGFEGMVSGRSSVKYAVVLGQVMDALWGERHPPNFLCGGTPRPVGLLHDAVRLSKGPPQTAELPPTLFYRLLFESPASIRCELKTLWKEGPCDDETG